MSPHGCSAVRCRIPDVRNCSREIISFINQRPYVSTSSHLTSHTILHPPTTASFAFFFFPTSSSSLSLLVYLYTRVRNGMSPSHPPNGVKRNGQGLLTIIRYRLRNCNVVSRRIAPDTHVHDGNPQKRRRRRRRRRGKSITTALS